MTNAICTSNLKAATETLRKLSPGQRDQAFQPVHCPFHECVGVRHILRLKLKTAVVPLSVLMRFWIMVPPPWSRLIPRSSVVFMLGSLQNSFGSLQATACQVLKACFDKEEAVLEWKLCWLCVVRCSVSYARWIKTVGFSEFRFD